MRRVREFDPEQVILLICGALLCVLAMAVLLVLEGCRPPATVPQPAPSPVREHVLESEPVRVAFVGREPLYIGTRRCGSVRSTPDGVVLAPCRALMRAGR